MDIKNEMFANVMVEAIKTKMEWAEIDFSKEIESKSADILSQIKNVLHNETDDFMIVDRIVDIFIKNGIDTGTCQDF
ncbi:MAG: hypothetical protein UIM24_03035 [Clostridia bacterium]|nr:hypothetical protein [Clostridia bacterium]